LYPKNYHPIFRIDSCLVSLQVQSFSKFVESKKLREKTPQEKPNNQYIHALKGKLIGAEYNKEVHLEKEVVLVRHLLQTALRYIAKK